MAVSRFAEPVIVLVGPWVGIDGVFHLIGDSPTIALDETDPTLVVILEIATSIRREFYVADIVSEFEVCVADIARIEFRTQATFQQTVEFVGRQRVL